MTFFMIYVPFYFVGGLDRHGPFWTYQKFMGHFGWGHFGIDPSLLHKKQHPLAACQRYVPSLARCMCYSSWSIVHSYFLKTKYLWQNSTDQLYTFCSIYNHSISVKNYRHQWSLRKNSKDLQVS